MPGSEEVLLEELVAELQMDVDSMEQQVQLLQHFSSMLVQLGSHAQSRQRELLADNLLLKVLCERSRPTPMHGPTPVNDQGSGRCEGEEGASLPQPQPQGDGRGRAWEQCLRALLEGSVDWDRIDGGQEEACD
mmetsp:Transcript_551/g.1751  ORF Transcript_551/g.1751 Transcript_551/m.1751 type:complete len:133 (-) Transcript_551:86-484(-)